jgi:hypothetical protein
MRDLGKIIMIAGAAMIVLGALVRWTSIGRLPGDLVYRRGNFSFYFPLMTSILLSIALTLLLWLFNRR